MVKISSKSYFIQRYLNVLSFRGFYDFPIFSIFSRFCINFSDFFMIIIFIL